MSKNRFKFRVENGITLVTLLIIFVAWFEVTRRGVVPKIFIPRPMMSGRALRKPSSKATTATASSITAW